MTVVLREPFASLWAGKDPFAAVEQLQGEVFRELEARRTLRLKINGAGFFVKIHRGIGWAEIFKNLLTLKAPVLGAANEWRAIARLTEAGVPTMTAVAYGQRGANPAHEHSFIITEELTPTIDLEKYCANWPNQPPAATEKHRLIREVAHMTRAMHQAGINHRDCYLCHFLMYTDRQHPDGRPWLSFIDLHRAQTRRHTPTRWRNKDLAGLYFSALEIGLTRRDKLRFLKAYFQRPLKEILRDEAALLAHLERRAGELLERYKRKYAPEAQ